MRAGRKRDGKHGETTGRRAGTAAGAEGATETAEASRWHCVVTRHGAAGSLRGRHVSGRGPGRVRRSRTDFRRDRRRHAARTTGPVTAATANVRISEGRVGEVGPGGTLTYPSVTSCLTVTARLRDGGLVGAHASLFQVPGEYRSDRILAELKQRIGARPVRAVEVRAPSAPGTRAISPRPSRVTRRASRRPYPRGPTRTVWPRWWRMNSACRAER